MNGNRWGSELVGTPQVTPQVAPQITTDVIMEVTTEVKRLLYVMTGDYSRRELQEILTFYSCRAEAPSYEKNGIKKITDKA